MTIQTFKTEELKKESMNTKLNVEELELVAAGINMDAAIKQHGSASRGSVGLYVDIGTDGLFKNLSIDYED